ncbi:MAG TPA: SUMF1/EgtB/PvdO family nonheme iron enzyme [Terriglobales bacterium]|nr:SUMF1/EgtB/PvdO family nonheme iron enzyme [Terriglobales bacterium]
MLAAQAGFNPKRELLARLAEARRLTDKVFGIVKPECLYDRPIPERHRIVFYIGHLEAFDWNLLQTALNRKSSNPELDRLFAFGIDPVDGGLPSDSPEDWPALHQVRQYQKSTRQWIDQTLRDLDFSESELGIPGLTPTMLLHVAIEHRLMHAETLAYMFHQFPLDHKIPQASIPTLSSTPSNNEMVTIPAGIATLGKNRDDLDFGWDNEYEELKVAVPAFTVDRFQVTNAEYLKFVNDHGYHRQELWSEEGWVWRVESRISHPVFWEKKGDGWQLRTMFHIVPLPQDWPVYVSHAEASAYARWAGKQLPTETQWHRAAYGTRNAENLFPWGRTLPEDMHGNFDFRNWDPVPVNAGQQQPSAFGVVGMIGNGWEWTSSIFEPLPGFQPFSFYPGYSANFFDGKHYVMKGGSPFTAASLLRRSFRNWFQPHYQYVYAGFRCVRNDV